MSFVLQFFDAPQADSVEKAVEHMDRSGDHDPAAAAKFERFVQLVTLLYPDLSEEDEDGDDDRNIWSEGLSGHERARPFFNVALKTHFVEEGILSIVASKAIMAGLQMLDPQNGMLYRADHVVVDQWGKQSPFRMLTPFAAKAMKPLRGGLNAPQVRQHIGAQLHEAFLKPHGFALTCTDSHAVVWRQRGDIRQAIAIQASNGADAVDTALSLWVSSNQLSAVWLAALPATFAQWKAEGDEACGGVAYDFYYTLTDVVASPSPEAVAQFGDNCPLRSQGELDAFAAHLGAFSVEALLPVLDAMNDLASLSDLALADWSLDIARTSRVSLPEQMGMLVIARLTNHPGFEDFAQALTHNPYKAEAWSEFSDPEGRHLDQLIAHLRSMRPGTPPHRQP
jgi:hypothetical protein